MGLTMVRRVLDASRARGSQLLVLLALAFHADDDGLSWPSVPTLARETKLHWTNVTRRLRGLRVQGEITTERTEGRVNRYRITVPTPSATARGSSSATPSAAARGTPSATARRPLAPQLPESKENQKRDLSPAVPRRGNRKKPEVPFPTDWQLDSDMDAQARIRGCRDPVKTFAAFKAHAETHDRRVANWRAAWNQWCLHHDHRCPCQPERSSTGAHREPMGSAPAPRPVKGPPVGSRLHQLVGGVGRHMP